MKNRFKHLHHASDDDPKDFNQLQAMETSSYLLHE